MEDNTKDRNHVWTFTPGEHARGSNEWLIRFHSASQHLSAAASLPQALKRSRAIPNWIVQYAGLIDRFCIPIKMSGIHVLKQHMVQ